MGKLSCQRDLPLGHRTQHPPRRSRASRRLSRHYCFPKNKSWVGSEGPCHSLEPASLVAMATGLPALRVGGNRGRAPWPASPSPRRRAGARTGLCAEPGGQVSRCRSLRGTSPPLVDGTPRAAGAARSRSAWADAGAVPLRDLCALGWCSLSPSASLCSHLRPLVAPAANKHIPHPPSLGSRPRPLSGTGGPEQDGPGGGWSPPRLDGESDQSSVGGHSQWQVPRGEGTGWVPPPHAPPKHRLGAR